LGQGGRRLRQALHRPLTGVIGAAAANAGEPR
jgi:hypothetical protein